MACRFSGAKESAIGLADLPDEGRRLQIDTILDKRGFDFPHVGQGFGHLQSDETAADDHRPRHPAPAIMARMVSTSLKLKDWQKAPESTGKMN